MPRKIKGVIIEGTKFNSITEAAKYIDPARNIQGNLSHALLYNSDRKYKGLSIAYADKKLEDKIKQKYIENTCIESIRKSKKSCPVVCKTLGKTFGSICDAAKYAKVNEWTMSKKMETAGKFIDKNNNEYVRLVPMNTKNTYVNTGTTLCFESKKHVYNRAKIKQEIPMVSTKPSESIDLAKKVLKDKVVDLVNDNKLDMAKEFINIIEKLK